MANKNVLFGGRVVKVENRSGFDKSRLNALTTGVGTITPILKQLVIPSSGRVSVAIHAELPPLATNAYLRTHLKLEAFFVPMRLCYGGFQSWFAGEEMYMHESGTFLRANLPYGFITDNVDWWDSNDVKTTVDFHDAEQAADFGHSTLTDYFNVKFNVDGNGKIDVPYTENFLCFHGANKYTTKFYGLKVNIFPYIAYHLIYHHFYRNKLVQKPVFVPEPLDREQAHDFTYASTLPYLSAANKTPVVLDSGLIDSTSNYTASDYFEKASNKAIHDKLADGSNLFALRQRNYGDDYFTCARPQAQAGNPVQVQTDANGRFTIASIRTQNALQEFAENQSYSSPDYVQALSARYGSDLSNGVAQKPIILGSADFPMYTQGVELNAPVEAASYSSQGSSNPFTNAGILGSKAGFASANGSEFVCDFNVNEPGYIMVLATLVPEANYASGIAHDMRIFIKDGDLTDLPCGLLEHVGDEPIMESEIVNSNYAGNMDGVFGYVQRYLWHKCGGPNEIHGLFAKGRSLEAFIPQRDILGNAQISTNFLQIPTTALDSVAAVGSGISQYGVMMDCAIKLSVSEPLSESALPSLSNPAIEHGRSVYLKNGGSKLA